MCIHEKAVRFIVDQFELVSKYNPTGDQPEAIAKLVDGLRNGDREQQRMAEISLRFQSSTRNFFEFHRTLSISRRL